MTDRYPKSLEELTTENAQLRSTVGQLQTSIGTLQSTLIAKDAELAKLRNPANPPIRLDAESPDKFRRPMGRRVL